MFYYEKKAMQNLVKKFKEDFEYEGKFIYLILIIISLKSLL